jgi:hypothetical protein
MVGSILTDWRNCTQNRGTHGEKNPAAKNFANFASVVASVSAVPGRVQFAREEDMVGTYVESSNEGHSSNSSVFVNVISSDTYTRIDYLP